MTGSEPILVDVVMLGFFTVSLPGSWGGGGVLDGVGSG
jgi:hypothetical protein